MFSNVCFPHLFKVPVHSEQILTDSIIISFNLLIFSTYPRQFIAHLIRFTTEKFFFSSDLFFFTTDLFFFTTVPLKFSTGKCFAHVKNNFSVVNIYFSLLKKKYSYLFIQQTVLKYFNSV